MKQTNQAIEIPLSKTKIVYLWFLSALFVILGSWLWTIADNQTRYLPIYVQIVSILCISFFGLGLILVPRKLFDKRPGLIISDEGIQDNTSVSTGRFISWANITGLDTVKIKSTRILLIRLNNAEENINRESKWKQRVMRFSLDTYGTPISIGSGTLKCNFDELLKMLTERMNSVKS